MLSCFSVFLTSLTPPPPNFLPKIYCGFRGRQRVPKRREHFNTFYSFITDAISRVRSTRMREVCGTVTVDNGAYVFTFDMRCFRAQRVRRQWLVGFSSLPLPKIRNACEPEQGSSTVGRSESGRVCRAKTVCRITAVINVRVRTRGVFMEGLRGLRPSPEISEKRFKHMCIFRRI